MFKRKHESHEIKLRPTEAIAKCLRNYKNFHGRASRSEFRWFSFVTFLCAWPLLLTTYSDELLIQVLSFFYLILTLAVVVPQAAVWCRRMHDVGKSGKLWTFIFLPVIGWLMLWRWTHKPGDPEDNDYGPVPVPEGF